MYNASIILGKYEDGPECVDGGGVDVFKPKFKGSSDYYSIH